VRPFAAILGVLMGSFVSLAFGLGVTLFVFVVLRHDDARFAEELPELWRAVAMFAVLAVLSCAGFLGTVRGARWRYVPLGLMWVGTVLVGWYYWPK
jgi:hypothetical protein